MVVIAEGFKTDVSGFGEDTAALVLPTSVCVFSFFAWTGNGWGTGTSRLGRTSWFRFVKADVRPVEGLAVTPVLG